MPEYIIANTEEDYKAAAALFLEYAGSLPIDLGFQHFDEELGELKEMYSPENGGIILAKDNDSYIACVAVRRINESTGELKRMYVQPEWQGKGMGRELLAQALKLAIDTGYKSIRLDTLNSMTSAIALYKKNGFYEIPAYYHNPESTAVYFEKLLT